MTLNQTSKRAHRGMLIGTSFVIVANLAAIIAVGFFGEELANIFTSWGEIVWQKILGVMVIGDWVGEERRVEHGGGHFGTRNSR